MKEVELLPDDPKAAECIKQLEQVILSNMFLYSPKACMWTLLRI